jgi:hypothetical protein
MCISVQNDGVYLTSNRNKLAIILKKHVNQIIVFVHGALFTVVFPTWRVLKVR